MLDKKKLYLNTFFFKFNKIKKNKIALKFIWVYTFFKIYFKYLFVKKKYLQTFNHYYLYSYIIFKTNTRNKFLNLLRNKNIYFITAGILKRKKKKLKFKKKKFIRIEKMLGYTMVKNLIKLSKLISLRYLKLKKYLFSTLNILHSKLKRFNKKIAKFKYYSLHNIYLIENKIYGTMKVKKIARSKRFLKRRRLKIIFVY